MCFSRFISTIGMFVCFPALTHSTFRHWLQNQDDWVAWQEDQVAGMYQFPCLLSTLKVATSMEIDYFLQIWDTGTKLIWHVWFNAFIFSRTRALPHDHYQLLSRCNGNHACLRYHECQEFRQHRSMAPKHRRGSFIFNPFMSSSVSGTQVKMWSRCYWATNVTCRIVAWSPRSAVSGLQLSTRFASSKRPPRQTSTSTRHSTTWPRPSWTTWVHFQFCLHHESMFRHRTRPELKHMPYGREHTRLLRTDSAVVKWARFNFHGSRSLQTGVNEFILL